METTKPETIRQFLREIGDSVAKTLTVQIGGSAALILPGYLSKRTDDVDIVNEVPAEIRSQRQFLANLKHRYGLEVSHLQSHYLPSSWAERLHSHPSLGRLQVFLVDKYDVCLSKLFSRREKDRDDLRVMLPLLDKETLVSKLKEDCRTFLSNPIEREMAQKNWNILFGEPLPS